MAATTSMRQSCDRCHGQKLRCTRFEDSDTGACSRCVNQSLQCVYSHSLPKGRPSQARQQANQAAAANASSQTALKRRGATPVSADGRSRASTKRRSTATPASSTNANTTTTSTPSTTATTTTTTTITAPSSTVPTVGTPSTRADDFMDASSGTPSLTEAMTESLESMMPWGGLSGWSDLSVDGSEPTLDWNDWMTSHDGPNDSLFDLISQQHATFPDRMMAPDKEDDGLSLEKPFQFRPGIDREGDDASGPDAGMAQLTQLSTHLYALQRLSHSLASDAALRSSPPLSWDATKHTKAIDRAVFASLMTRLSQNTHRASPKTADASKPPAIHDILQDALSASHQLLATLGDLRARRRGSLATPSSRNSPRALPTPTGSVHWGYPDQRGPEPDSAPMSRSGSQTCNIVTQHLVMACHGMLQSIYAAVLGVLQRDADALASLTCLPDFEKDPTTKDATEDPLPDVQLVMIVQLCAYLLKRQQQAVSCFLTSDGSGTPAPPPPPATTASPLPSTHLDPQLEQQLSRLLHTLRI